MPKGTPARARTHHQQIRAADFTIFIFAAQKALRNLSLSLSIPSSLAQLVTRQILMLQRIFKELNRAPRRTSVRLKAKCAKIIAKAL
jgi:hypothetical protein